MKLAKKRKGNKMKVQLGNIETEGKDGGYGYVEIKISQVKKAERLGSKMVDLVAVANGNVYRFQTIKNGFGVFRKVW